MSRIRADRVTNKLGTGAPLFPNGIRVVGLTSISNIAASTGTFTGAVSIGGTLTYEDVTNVDSVGVITARSGIVATGVVTATSFAGSGVSNSANVTIASDESDEVSNSSIIFKTDGTEKVRIGNSAGHGCVGISTGVIDPDGNKLLIRGASTIGTNKGHIMLTGDGSTVGEGPQIVFSESGPGANWAGAYIGHTRQGGGSLGDLRFGTRAAAGDANTVPTERLRIGSAGQFGIGGANYGTSGQVLTSGGGSAAPQWADAGGGQWKALTTGSATSGQYGNITTSLLTSAYVAYKVTWYARMSSDGWVGLQQYHDGAYASDTNYYWSYIQCTSNGNGVWTGGDGASRNVVRLGYTSMREWQGEVRIWRPDITTHAPVWYYWSQGAHANGVANGQINLDRGVGNYHWGGGVKTPTGCRLYADSTISYMWWTLYGLT